MKNSARAYREVATIIAESFVIIAAADRRIHAEEKKRLASAMKTVWNANYGSIKTALLGAFQEVKLAQDFDMDLKSRLKKNAAFLSKIFSDKEKNSFLGQIEYLMRADGSVAKEEYDCYMLLKKNMNPPAGFLGSLKTSLVAWAQK